MANDPKLQDLFNRFIGERIGEIVTIDEFKSYLTHKDVQYHHYHVIDENGENSWKSLVEGSGASIEECKPGYFHIPSNAINETLRYPTKAHKRKQPTQARKRSTVLGEDVFLERLNDILEDDSLSLYHLVDEGSDSILFTDFITESEAKQRNQQLIDKDEPFRWVIA